MSKKIISVAVMVWILFVVVPYITSNTSFIKVEPAVSGTIRNDNRIHLLECFLLKMKIIDKTSKEIWGDETCQRLFIEKQ